MNAGGLELARRTVVISVTVGRKGVLSKRFQISESLAEE
jgi:hypothetical protein